MIGRCQLIVTVTIICSLALSCDGCAEAENRTESANNSTTAAPRLFRNAEELTNEAERQGFGARESTENLRRRFGFYPSSSSGGLDTNLYFFGGARNQMKDFIGAIFPGTLWCGTGNRARSREDLGRYTDTDACCREHDECPENIPPGGVKFGLQNTGAFTRSHCDCDIRFYSCLKRVNTAVSRQMGISYFSVLGPQCFRLEKPIIYCAIVHRERCIRYELAQEAPLEYQWFDLPKF